ncbi:hypothetical protein MNV49_002565 [Pseudohyphozyma bogoriensis]|nr:hypothetical protein MNV49_002565 [Pseudohyphozyma bogoriensis]
MMKVMSLGMAGGSSSSSKHQSQLSADLSSDDGLSLSRQSSRLQPPNGHGHSPASILINSPNRPYQITSAASSATSVNDLPRTTSGSSLHRLSSTPSRSEPFPSSQPSSPRTSPNQSTSSHLSPASASASTADEPERGRSSSRDSAAPGDAGRTKIRFAPLPEIRQRSYSTGRNVWLDPEDVSNGLSEGGGARGFVRRESTDVGFDDDESLDLSDDEDAGQSKGIFGSWKSDSGSFGGRSNTSDSSYTTKLLRPFGMGKKKKNRNSVSEGADSLARVESNESDVSRGSSRHSMDASLAPPHRPGSTGVPMRKTRTWELGEGGSRRANYPPVAQRSRNARRPSTATSSVPDPSFVEWGFGSSGVGAVTKPGGKADDDDDDGSGMAWIKKRRAEREAAAKKKAEEDAAAAASKDDEPTMEVIPKVALSPPPTSPPIGGLSATRPILNVVTDADRPEKDSSFSPTEDSSSTSSLNSPNTESSDTTSPDLEAETPKGKRLSFSSNNGGSDDEDDEEDDANDDANADDDDSDLDEDELAEEERLAEAARATSKSAGAERYHTASHANRMLNVEGKPNSPHIHQHAQKA